MKKLKEIRKEKKLTQKQLAEKAGISIAAYQRYENGDRSPTIETAKKISDALGVSEYEIFSPAQGMQQLNERLSILQDMEILLSEKRMKILEDGDALAALISEKFDGPDFFSLLEIMKNYEESSTIGRKIIDQISGIIAKELPEEKEIKKISDFELIKDYLEKDKEKRKYVKFDTQLDE